MMTYKFPSAEWLDALKNKLNIDEKYAQTAKKWEGEIVFYIEPGGPIKDTMIFYTDLWHGECRDAFIVETENQLKELAPAYILSAPYQSFVRVLKGQLDPMQAMITRKLQVQGSMGYMMRTVPTVLEFVRCAKEIDTQFVE
jgi:putative sterol carrier protein